MLLLLLLSVLFAFWLQRRIYRRYWAKDLSVQAEFADSYAYEGGVSHLREEICNRKKLPLPAVEVRLSMSRNLEFSSGAKANSSITDLSYKRDVFSFLFHQKVIHTLPFICRRRGFYRITNVEVIGYDLFFDTRHYLDVPQHTQFYVYPAQIDARRIRLICQAIAGMVLVQNRLYPDPFEFSGIREYRPADPMRRINWKASARCGSLMVNEFDSTTSIQATIVLDVEDSHILRYEALTEEGIRIASSLAAKMVKEHMELELISNAVIKEEEGGAPRQLCWTAKAEAGQVAKLNRQLACIDTQEATEPISSVLAQETAQKRSGRIYVLISKNQEHTADALNALAANGNEILWILPVRSAMKLEARETPSVHLMRWEVLT